MRLLKSLLFVMVFVGLFIPEFVGAKERQVEVTLQFNLNTPAETKDVRLWVPYPVSDRNQKIEDVKVTGNFANMGVYRESEYGSMMLYSEWNSPVKERTLTYSFKVKRKDVVTKDFPKKELRFSEYEFDEYLRPSRSCPTGGKVKEYATRITKGKKTVLAKARAVYDWIVDNMHRDPDIKGCGLGVVETLLEKRGGKCADLHSVFVALARSSGVPAREVFGIRIPKGKEGDMTKAQHCWAEFYLPGYGWIVVDPADVRKAILEQKLTMEQAKPVREYYFGAVDENRIAFGTGRDLRLNPAQSGDLLNYLMYPYAEFDGKTLNEDLFGFNVGYKISFREM